MLDQLERRLGRFAIPHVTLYLIIGQVFVLLTSMFQLLDPSRLILDLLPATHGEPWRFVTFMFMPPPFSGRFSLVMLPFVWSIFYLMGNALEHEWGVFRYNLYLLTGYLLTIAAAFVAPEYPTSNYYLMVGVSVAFAWFNPNFELQLFFILPVKVKWLALIAVFFAARDFAVGPRSIKCQIGAAVLTFFLFFGRSLLDSIRYRRRQMAVESRRVAEERNGPEARHRCRICGKTDLTNPEMDFRYCSKCAGDECYCPEHISNHEHVVATSDEANS